MTNRDKTGKEVYVKVSAFVIDALNNAPHDSAEYFFWSGRADPYPLEQMEQAVKKGVHSR